MPKLQTELRRIRYLEVDGEYDKDDVYVIYDTLILQKSEKYNFIFVELRFISRKIYFTAR